MLSAPSADSQNPLMFFYMKIPPLPKEGKGGFSYFVEPASGMEVIRKKRVVTVTGSIPVPTMKIKGLRVIP
jgi:hypothetical protein